MDYSLAKELKDGGFEQDGRGIVWGGQLPKYGNKQEMVYAPTLEELIEACLKECETFELLLNDGWSATKDQGLWDTEYDKFLELTTEGKTPTEAVAKLWLALNKT